MKELATSDSLETRTYFVAVDHASRSVVVSIRGTYSFTDTMVDLLCNTVGELVVRQRPGLPGRSFRAPVVRLCKTMFLCPKI